ncbi:MAG TPA: Calx-beta domain-containing protein, partial [Lacipirellulaceae bacterium]|nr:Calx-beta domain-containing protein [Lacipirellulaceae bacterium]
TGQTNSNFPTRDAGNAAWQTTYHPGQAGNGSSTTLNDGDNYVAKFCLASQGDRDLIYSTYLGGSDADDALALAYDGQGGLIIGGATLSTDFPLAHAFQSSIGVTSNGNTTWDSFISKFSGSVISFQAGGFDVTTSGTASGTTNATITLTRTGDTTNAASVTFFTANGSAHAPGDYTFTSQSVNFAAGASTATVTVPVVNEASPQPDRTVLLGLSCPTDNATLGLAPTGSDGISASSPGTGTLTIHNGGGSGTSTPAVSFIDVSASAARSQSAYVVSVQLTSPATGTVTVPYTLTGSGVLGQDYSVSASVFTIQPGATTGSVTVSFLQTAAPLLRTINLTLHDPVNATLGPITTFVLQLLPEPGSTTKNGGALGGGLLAPLAAGWLSRRRRDGRNIAVRQPGAVAADLASGRAASDRELRS